MVPEAYHPFFSGCASVAGALIGLLFVAISVAPHKMAGERADVAFQVGAGTAFAALLNTLVVALVALLPGTNLAITSLVLAAVGISSVAGLTVISLVIGDSRHHLGGLTRLGALLVVFALQMVTAVRLLPDRHEDGPIHSEAGLCLVLFIIASNQAWKLLDAQGTRLFPVLVQLLRRHHSAESEATCELKKPTPGP